MEAYLFFVYFVVQDNDMQPQLVSKWHMPGPKHFWPWRAVLFKFCLVACRLLLSPHGHTGYQPVCFGAMADPQPAHSPAAATFGCSSAPPRMVSFSCGEIRALAKISLAWDRRRVAGRWSWNVYAFTKGRKYYGHCVEGGFLPCFFGRTWCKGTLKNLHQSSDFGHVTNLSSGHVVARCFMSGHSYLKKIQVQDFLRKQVGNPHDAGEFHPANIYIKRTCNRR